MEAVTWSPVKSTPDWDTGSFMLSQKIHIQAMAQAMVPAGSAVFCFSEWKKG